MKGTFGNRMHPRILKIQLTYSHLRAMAPKMFDDSWRSTARNIAIAYSGTSTDIDNTRSAPFFISSLESRISVWVLLAQRRKLQDKHTMSRLLLCHLLVSHLVCFLPCLPQPHQQHQTIYFYQERYGDNKCQAKFRCKYHHHVETNIYAK